jgi:type II secretory pathway component GspD/PulD (secretin)
VLSNPQILTVNRHAAELLVGSKLPYITTTVTQTGSLQSVSFLEVGTSLVFRPFVSEDGYVRMEVYPKKSSGFINPDGLPEETTTEVKTNILVREGNTVVIGGLMESSMVTQTEQIPFFGSLPLIGEFFQSQRESEIKTEIIVMLTPHIVDDASLSSRSNSSKQRLQAAHAELAASHHGYLRPSYARDLYREAAVALAAGDVRTALAKAEWGLSAMPADPDLAALAAHCRNEIFATRDEALELRDTLQFLNQIETQETK